jgi:hypothetical protein
LEGVHAASGNGRWKIAAGLFQETPEFDLRIDALLECGDSCAMNEIALSGNSTPLHFECSSAPMRLTMDPDFHLLRRLDAAEIPPAVNLLKSSPSVLLVLPAGDAGPLRALAETLALALGLNEYQLVTEENLKPEMFSSRDVILMGLPTHGEFMPRLPAGIRLKKHLFVLNGRTYEDSSDVFFGVFRHPSGEDRVLALFHPLSIKDAGIVARKVTHYGRYSYVTFQNGLNQEKGFWPVEHSPVVHEFIKEKGAP